MKSLTKRQAEIFTFIREAIMSHGMPPTIAEITRAMGVKSSNGIRDHLQALARKGVIELVPGASRGIRLLGMPDSELSHDSPVHGSLIHNKGLPVVGRVAAGDPILAQQHIEDYCRVDADTFRPKADFLLRVRGMSMRDAGIFDHDLVAVHHTPEGRNGQIVVARLDNEATVKRLQRKAHKVYLHAENPDFETIVVDLRYQELCVEGVVVGVIRSM